MKANPHERAETSVIDAAMRVGETLCETAHWHESRCNWVGRSPRESTSDLPTTPTVAALGPEVYTGTAGIALFLSHLHARTGIEAFRRTALGAIRQALGRSENVPPAMAVSFYSGLVGIAYAAVRVGRLIDDSELIESGMQLAHRAVSAPDSDRLLDVIGGNAGAIAPLLWLAKIEGGESLQTSSLDLATELAAAATKRDGTWCWNNDRASGTGVGPTPLCGFAHGASGMGLALIEIGVRYQQQDWIEGGLAAFRYEDQLYDAGRGNWPDLRELTARGGAPHDRQHASFMVAWCHGAAGIGLARLRAHQLLPQHRADLQIGVEQALRTTAAHLQSVPADFDASPCHGRGGLAETLLHASATLDDRQYADQAFGMWEHTVRTRSVGQPWSVGVASGRNNPSLMLGLAGIGYALLRACSPDEVPSILLIDPDR